MWNRRLRLVWLWAMGAAAPSFAAPIATPSTESEAGRRAVRGTSVEVAHESDALRQLREFEEESFPRSEPYFFAAEEPKHLEETASRDVGPDAIPGVLRSPERAEKSDSASPFPTTMPWLGALQLPPFGIRLEARLLRYLEFYKTDPRGRSIMADWLKKQGRWRALFEAELEKAHLPTVLIYVAMIESGYDPHDRSHAGAVGLWQFMPEGGRIYGLRIDHWVDERQDPERATQAVVHYFSDLKERFGSWAMVLAAFNAGYGAVLRAMQKYNTNDYWELCAHEDGLPWETTLYVPKAMAAAIVGENRALFGYDKVPSDLPFAYDRVLVPSSMSLVKAARAAGAPPEEVAALNPELRRGRTPPERWSLRLPRGTGERFRAAYEAHREKLRPFVVRFGERLDELAAAVGSTRRELRALNGIEDSSEIRPGMTLLVPEGRTPTAPTPMDTVIVAVPDKTATIADRKRIFYRTLPRDTVAEVARFFGVKPSDLQLWNHLDVDAKLAGGMVLQLWVALDYDGSKAALVDPAIVRVVTTGSPEFFDLVEARRGRKRLTYTVKSGDDLKKIGKRFGLTVADLERINRFGAAHTPLRVGQKLTVYASMSTEEKARARGRITPDGVGTPEREAEVSVKVNAKEASGDDTELPRPPVEE